MPTPLQNLKTEFLTYLEIEKNRSPKTIRNYDFYLERFFGQSGVKKPGDITLPAVKQFRLWLNRVENDKFPGENLGIAQFFEIPLQDGCGNARCGKDRTGT
jgi:hypothetical protein